MEFLLVIRHDEAFRPTEELVAAIHGWIRAMSERGVRVDGRPLRPAGEARAVRVRDDEVSVSAGPFGTESDRVAAYEVIEAPDLDAAVVIAAGHPMARVGTVEVREVWSDLSAGPPVPGRPT